MTANDKNPIQDLENLLSPTQMQLSLKTKKFSDFFFHFWNLYQILNVVETKTIFLATLLRKSQPVKNLVGPLSKNYFFRKPFDSQHVKGSQTLVKSAREHFHHVLPSLWENMT